MQRQYALAMDHFKKSIGFFELVEDFEIDMLANLG